MDLAPIMKKISYPAINTAKDAPFNRVFFSIFTICFARREKSTMIPMIFVMHTKEKADTVSGTLLKNTYCIAARNVINIRPDVARPLLVNFIILSPC